MINIIVAYDSTDNEIGEFFLQCYYDLVQYFKNPEDYNIQWIDGDTLSRDNIEKSIRGFEENPFIFLAYSHGYDDSLECDEGAYVDINNSYFFGNSFFYTFSCKSGNELGPSLISQKCKNFIGYNDNASVILTDLPYFVECANSGIKCFFEKQNSLEAYKLMLDKYEEVVDRIKAQENIDDDIISTLTSNKNALILLPNNGQSVSIEEFILEG